MNDSMERLKVSVEALNEALKTKYTNYFHMSDEVFRRDVLSEIGTLSRLQKLDEASLSSLGELVGVDGSVVKVGGLYPHYVELYRGLAKSTYNQAVTVNDIYTPILERDTEERNRDRMLAKVELDAAIEFLSTYSPRIVMMDGGLIRYNIFDSVHFKRLVNLCREKDVILMGVIKDIKTDLISSTLGLSHGYDRELLHGRLQRGEVLYIDNDISRKYKEADLVSAFLRTGVDSMCIGLDLMAEYEDRLPMMANLVYTLTPEHSRGVPLWLDIVDSEVKLTEAMVRSVLETYLDRDIYRRFFISERDGRTR
ncbi:DNA double-strand break repair nuclease NurA [Peptoniphilus equinus]|uniref:DNA double-strand break repair nuclease NurA n=1 Tax=Peptoniphilus equinus TaxID=3016343 RepID=A0ABY7QVY1_9FIRM|nr:DNA double-strand break repair nuclease NurA [Peptoniphilus equinus]WBW50521.1 DNA double-strand break repair nuclease NurA [Peptoniphilus equinus]